MIPYRYYAVMKSREIITPKDVITQELGEKLVNKIHRVFPSFELRYFKPERMDIQYLILGKGYMHVYGEYDLTRFERGIFMLEDKVRDEDVHLPPDPDRDVLTDYINDFCDKINKEDF